MTESPQNSEAIIHRKISDRFVDLIDIVFGVVVATNIATFFKDNPLTSFPVFSEIFSVKNGSFFVAYSAIILSWVGYHQMMEYNPYKPKIYGSIRFGIDLIIVFIYTVLIYSITNFTLFLLVFPIIYILYLLGGVVRKKEYNKKVNWSKGSLILTIVFSINFIIWFICDVFLNFTTTLNPEPVQWMLIISTLWHLFYYRWERSRAGFKK